MNKKIVLVAVLKSPRDLNMLLKKQQYRIPVLYAPKKKADYIAFYQPSSFGKSGSCIRRYAKAKGWKIVKRKSILPGEKDHPGANEDYYLVNVGRVQKLRMPVTNKTHMRVSFGFTTLATLLGARDVGKLFDVPPIEDIMFHALRRRGIDASRQHGLTLPDGKRYRMDFATFCKKGPLNIECDGEKWHSIRAQQLKDAVRDRALGKEGWAILRLGESEIVNDTGKCLKRVEKSIRELGGRQ